MYNSAQLLMEIIQLIKMVHDGKNKKYTINCD